MFQGFFFTKFLRYYILFLYGSSPLKSLEWDLNSGDALREPDMILLLGLKIS